MPSAHFKRNKYVLLSVLYKNVKPNCPSVFTRVKSFTQLGDWYKESLAASVGNVWPLCQEGGSSVLFCAIPSLLGAEDRALLDDNVIMNSKGFNASDFAWLKLSAGQSC